MVGEKADKAHFLDPELFPASLLFEVENADQAFRRLRNAHAHVKKTAFVMGTFFVFLGLVGQGPRLWLVPIGLACFSGYLSSIRSLSDLDRTKKCTEAAISSLSKTLVFGSFAAFVALLILVILVGMPENIVLASMMVPFFPAAIYLRRNVQRFAKQCGEFA